MDVRVNDKIELKSASMRFKLWSVLRVGTDFKIQCSRCGHEVMLPAPKSKRKLKNNPDEAPSQSAGN